MNDRPSDRRVPKTSTFGRAPGFLLLLGVLTSVFSGGCARLGKSVRPLAKTAHTLSMHRLGKPDYVCSNHYLGYHQTTWREPHSFGRICPVSCPEVVEGDRHRKCGTIAVWDSTQEDAATVDTGIRNRGDQPFQDPGHGNSREASERRGEGQEALVAPNAEPTPVSELRQLLKAGLSNE